MKQHLPTEIPKRQVNCTERFLKLLGLCRRAGKTVHGTPLVFTALAGKNPPCLVILSDSASDATRKKVMTKCDFYGVSLITVAVSTEALAKAVGKTGNMATVAVADENFARELSKIHAIGQKSSTED